MDERGKSEDEIQLNVPECNVCVFVVLSKQTKKKPHVFF